MLVNMMNNANNYPYLLNRKQAAEFLGIDPTTFDKYVRIYPALKTFMIGKQERYTIKSLIELIDQYSVSN